MRTLHIGLRVEEIEKSLEFYEAIGYEVIGNVPETSHGSLTMLDAARAQLAARGVEVDEPQLPGGENGPRTSWITDPDGNRIELVQWPDGHAPGMSADDFPH